MDPNENPQPAAQPEQPEMNKQDSDTSSTADGAPSHFDDLIDETEKVEHVEAQQVLTADMVSKEEFFKLFKGSFTATHQLTKLQSLKIAPDRMESAEACSGAIYDTILDIPMLHFMLKPVTFGKWAVRLYAIGIFTLPMSASVAEELRERRAARGRQRPQPDKPEAAGAAHSSDDHFYNASTKGSC